MCASNGALSTATNIISRSELLCHLRYNCSKWHKFDKNIKNNSNDNTSTNEPAHYKQCTFPATHTNARTHTYKTTNVP